MTAQPTPGEPAWLRQEEHSLYAFAASSAVSDGFGWLDTRGDPASPDAKATRFGVQGLEPGAPYVRMVPRIAEYAFVQRYVDCPVTIAWGDRDRTLLPSSAVHAHERVPNARMVSLLGSGHIPMADDPVAVAEHIRWTCRSADRGHAPRQPR